MMVMEDGDDDESNHSAPAKNVWCCISSIQKTLKKLSDSILARCLLEKPIRQSYPSSLFLSLSVSVFLFLSLSRSLQAWKNTVRKKDNPKQKKKEESGGIDGESID